MPRNISVTVCRLANCARGTRRIEFSGKFADRGGLITFTEMDDKLVVDLHHLDPEVEVRVDRERLGRKRVNYDARTGDCIRYMDANWMVDETYPSRCVIFSASANCERQLIEYDILYAAKAYYLE